MNNGKMNLRATIIIDIRVDNFMEAGEHQKRLLEFLESIRKTYPVATLDLKVPRPRGGLPVHTARDLPLGQTGNLRPYGKVL